MSAPPPKLEKDVAFDTGSAGAGAPKVLVLDPKGVALGALEAAPPNVKTPAFELLAAGAPPPNEKLLAGAAC